MKKKKLHKHPFVDLIIRARKNKKYKQSKVAQAVKMSISNYGHIETGRVELSADALVRICEFLGIKIQLVLDQEVLK